MSTRGGSLIRIYEVFEGRYINFAYYDRDTDVWWPRQANWDGTDALGEYTLGLYNVREKTSK